MAKLDKPQINLARPTAARMWLVSLGALLGIIQSSLTDSGKSLIIGATAGLAALAAEALIYFRTDQAGTIKDGSAITSALILTLFLPNTLHPVYGALGAVFAMTIVKHSFGGLGSNWLNPAVGGWLFVRFSCPAAFDTSLENSMLVRIAESVQTGLADPEGSPLGLLKVAKAEYGPTIFDGFIRAFLRDGLFSLAKLEFPKGYSDLFNASAPGIIADRGILALLAGTILISASQVSRGWIPAVFLTCYLVLVRLFGALPFGGGFAKGDVFFGLFSGGVVPAAFLLAPDPSTGPKSNLGALVSGALAGGGTFLFRYIGGEGYGAIFAIALLNCLVPVIRDLESRKLYKTA
ncbi:MAG: RnfABCDGE type electron transport complex subunit D [Spirochaetaceae bacterium]|jgi:electron transport complex protein RnfD|nr:RnfABCDGE type electron transport complex subunit D [Spirochaetaceae bacterium]